MGQAKRRGTYIERRTLAIKKAGEEREARKVRLQKEYDDLTLEQRAKKREAQRVLAGILAASNTLMYRI